MLKILFPAKPSDPRTPDPDFQEQFDASTEVGFGTALLGTEIHFGEDPVIKGREAGDAYLYRGWILRSNEYLRLADALKSSMLVDYGAYTFSMEFPAWYLQLKDFEREFAPCPSVTPRSIEFPATMTDSILWSDSCADHEGGGTVESNANTFELDYLPEVAHQVALAFTGPVMVKDYLKSRKHEWHDACYMPDAENQADVLRVLTNFVTRQCADGIFHGGLVVREFVTFKAVGYHPKSKMPLTNEWRIFVLHGKVLYSAPYWSDGSNYSGQDGPPMAFVELIAARIKGTPFFTLDVAQLEDGNWMVVELNDGGTAGIPEGGNVKDFYAALGKALL